MSLLKQLLKDVLKEEFRKACSDVTVDWNQLEPGLPLVFTVAHYLRNDMTESWNLCFRLK